MTDKHSQDYLVAVLTLHLPERGQVWLRTQLENPLPEKALYLAFSLVPRFTGKHPLPLTGSQLQEAGQLRLGFNPEGWTADQATRTLLLLRVAHQSPAEYSAVINRLFKTADLNELAALYAALPLLPYPETHVLRAAEGVRTTMTSVFDAIALGNPYPYDYLPQEAWNQLVLKAVFNARPLYRIYGLDQRRNEPLAHMLLDYAHERWAAGRTLTPEVWRLVGPYLTADSLPDVRRLLHSDDALQVQAGTLALAESRLPAALALLSEASGTQVVGQERAARWERIGAQAYG
ncbi:hypothetical protein SAMN00120144_0263 [Hymenobacter roseosalivarius DSM 11622]|uniref:ERAP1-like C-terminal domain-containing protein n=1 Tax=Hymenobacter roseosalivarius DSM 11622 TaxID=645990 RepID=A0A1W1W2E4_9BACT|nr:EboA domain-containing protein [Hymenobacter roseosalivarius]SMB99561.1 hypothetical protein SAMN00120144_0263 [Hymenobacter roseosalivarius DSM 11622]